MPTYGYELSQAVKDGFLVDYFSIETKLKFLEEGIVYEDLSDEDKAAYEETFANEDGEVPEKIDLCACTIKVVDSDNYAERKKHGF